MTSTNIYSDAFYHDREIAVREQIDQLLDSTQKYIVQLHSPCLQRMMKIQEEMTLEDLLTAEPNVRQEILSAILFNDALWRIEAAYLMLALGMLNIVYSNLRSCLESVVNAHIVENLDSEAIRFLKSGKINPSKISEFIPEQYDKPISEMKEAFSEWGTHSRLKAVHLSVFYGPNTFDMFVSKTSPKRPQVLDESFKTSAKDCFEAIGQVYLLFMWIMSKGTSYRREKI